MACPGLRDAAEPVGAVVAVGGGGIDRVAVGLRGDLLGGVEAVADVEQARPGDEGVPVSASTEVTEFHKQQGP